jgi:hypothetical protein
MDAKLFRLPTQPNLYAGIAAASPFDLVQQQKRSSAAAPDNRFPGWAAQMADGRLVTDYQDRCAKNVPAGRQFATKEWMTKNAEQIIRLGRERLAFQTGAVYGLDTTVVPPPAVVVHCSRADCEQRETGAPGGIGMERAGAAAPPLFGTWDAGTMFAAPRAEVQLTRHYEGGRNTPRGGAGPFPHAVQMA